MAITARAKETLLSLRRAVAGIEGRPAEALGPAGPAEQANEGALILRRHGLVAPQAGLIATGAEAFDAALGGGLPRAALTEVHGAATAEAAAGFVLALVALLGGMAPLLWIGSREVFREAGFPYAPGLAFLYGLDPGRLLVAEARRLADALWIAEEGARLRGLAAVLVEVEGNPARLDLTATRRLHRRAQAAGRPVFLLRRGAVAEPTAAPVRLAVEAAPAGLRRTLAGPLAGSIGPPAFAVAITKNRTAPPARFTLEWNVDDRIFHERRAQDPLAVVPASQHGPHPAAQAGTVVALRPDAGRAATARQPAREQHPARRHPG